MLTFIKLLVISPRKEAIKIVGTDDIESLDKLPIIVVGDKVLYGFDKKEIDKYLK